MDWVTLTPTELRLTLDGNDALSLLQSLLDKIEQSPNPSIESKFLGSGEIIRLDGVLYNQAEYRVSVIQQSPAIDLNVEDIV